MSVAAEQLGREPLTVVELDLRQRIGAGFLVVTYRFCSHDVVPPIALAALPVVERVQTLPTKLDIGESLGLRAAISVTCRDFVNDNDVAGGPAHPEATFFRLLKARAPFVANRPARVVTGYLVGGVFVPERTLHYLLVRIDGPDRHGLVTLHLTDALVRAENRKAQAPNVGTGTLLAPIGLADTAATIAPAAAADDYHAAGGAAPWLWRSSGATEASRPRALRACQRLTIGTHDHHRQQDGDHEECIHKGAHFIARVVDGKDRRRTAAGAVGAHRTGRRCYRTSS